MRLTIRHEIRCRFEHPARNVAFVLRLTPRSHEGQHVSDWRLDCDIDCSLRAGQDAFGNITHAFGSVGPVTEVTISAAGEIDTFDTSGIVRGSAEPLPLDIFLRETEATAPDDAVRALARTVAGREAGELAALHGLMDEIHATIVAETADTAPGDARAVLAARRGGAAGPAHLFIAAARHLGIPSRLASGYVAPEGGAAARRHVWAEAHVPRIGWIGFDPVLNLCPAGDHARLAAGLDASGTDWLRGAPAPVLTHHLTIRALG